MNTNIFNENDLINFVESGPAVNTGDLTPVFSRTLFTGLVDASFSTGELTTPPKTAAAAANFSDLRLEATLDPAPIDNTATIFRVVQRFQYGIFQSQASCYNRNQLDTPDPSCGVATMDGDLSEIIVPGAVVDFPDITANYVATGSPNFNSAEAAFDTGPFAVDVEVETDFPLGITFAQFMTLYGTPRVNVSLFAEAEAQITVMGTCANAGPIEAITSIFFFFQNYELEVDWDVVAPDDNTIVGNLELAVDLDSEQESNTIEGDLELAIELADPNELEGDLFLGIELSGYGMEIVGDLQLAIDLDPVTVWSADASGLYILVPNKTDDTIYAREHTEETVDIAIPDPTLATAYIGG